MPSTPAEAPARRAGRGRLLALLKAAITALLLAGLASLVDVAALAQVLRRVDVVLLGAAAALLLVQAGLTAARWRLLAAQLGMPIGAGQAMHWVLVGQFLNLALPTSIGGDGFRVWKLHREGGGSLGDALLTVAIERGSGLVLLALLVSACSLALRGSVPQEQYVMLCALGPAMLLLVLPLGGARRWAGAVPWPRAAAVLRRVGDAFELLKARPALAAAVVALGLAGSAVGLFAAWTMTRSIGLDLGVAPVMALTGAAVIVAALPISFGGWGVREASMVGLLASLGVPAEAAVTVSLLWGLLPVVISAPAALVWAVSGQRAAAPPPAEAES